MDPVSEALRVGWRSRVAFVGAGAYAGFPLYVAHITSA